MARNHDSGDILHSASEFAAVPWDRMKSDRFGEDWSLACGGRGLRDDQWTVYILHPRGVMDIDEEAWVLPESLSRAMSEIRRIGIDTGKAQVRNAISDALGISERG